MKDSLKLFRITLRGFGYSYTGINYKIHYVIAQDPTKAYLLVRNRLDKKDIGFHADREMESIELLAEDSDYTEVTTLLTLS